jgi:hypothetical protein
MAARQRRLLGFLLTLAAFAPGCNLLPERTQQRNQGSIGLRADNDSDSSTSGTAIAGDEPRNRPDNRYDLPPANIQQSGCCAAATQEPQSALAPPVLPNEAKLPITDAKLMPAVQVTPIEADPTVVSVLRAMLDNRPDRAMEAIQRCPPNNQKLLLILMSMISDLGGGKVDVTDPVSAEHLDDLIRSAHLELRPHLPLKIEKMFFCRDIKSFGNYEPLPPRYEFRAGGGDHCGEMVQVYLELRNFPVRTQGDMFESTLASKIEIRDGQDQPVFRHDEQARVFRSRSPRSDMFFKYQFEVPPHLPPGTYSLSIEIDDTQSQPARSVRQAIEMRIISAGSVAAGSSE